MTHQFSPLSTRVSPGRLLDSVVNKKGTSTNSRKHAVVRRRAPLTPLDHLRLWFVSLNSDLQGEIASALVPAMEDFGP